MSEPVIGSREDISARDSAKASAKERWQQFCATQQEIDDLKVKLASELMEFNTRRRAIEKAIAAEKKKGAADEAYIRDATLRLTQLEQEENIRKDTLGRDIEDKKACQVVFTQAEMPFIRGFQAEKDRLTKRDILGPSRPRHVRLREEQEARESALKDLTTFFSPGCKGYGELGSKEMEVLTRLFQFADANNTSQVEDDDVVKTLRGLFASKGGLTNDEVDLLLLRCGIDSHQRLQMNRVEFHDLFRQLVPTALSFFDSRNASSSAAAAESAAQRDAFEHDYSMRLEALQQQLIAARSKTVKKPQPTGNSDSNDNAAVGSSMNESNPSAADVAELQRRIDDVIEQRKAARLAWAATATVVSGRQAAAAWYKASVSVVTKQPPKAAPPKADEARNSPSAPPRRAVASKAKAAAAPPPGESEAKVEQRLQESLRRAVFEAPWDGSTLMLNEKTMQDLHTFFDFFADGKDAISLSDITRMIAGASKYPVSEDDVSEYFRVCCQTNETSFNFDRFVDMGPAIFAKIADALYFDHFNKDEKLQLVRKKLRLNCPIASYERPIVRAIMASKHAAKQKPTAPMTSSMNSSRRGRESPLRLKPRPPAAPTAASRALVVKGSASSRNISPDPIIEQRHAEDDMLLATLSASYSRR